MTEIVPKVCKNPFSTLLAHSTVHGFRLGQLNCPVAQFVVGKYSPRMRSVVGSNPTKGSFFFEKKSWVYIFALPLSCTMYELWQEPGSVCTCMARAWGRMYMYGKNLGMSY